MIHRLPNGLEVEMVGADETDSYDAGEYGVYVRDAKGEELTSWTGDEWIEDPSIVAAIVNLIMHGAIEGPESLAERLAPQPWTP